MLTKQEKQRIQDAAVQAFQSRQWFYGAGWIKDTTLRNDLEDRFVIAFNYHPALDMVYIKEVMLKIGVEYELRSRSAVPGGENSGDDLPSHMRH